MPEKYPAMSLLENLRKRKLSPDFQWQILQFGEVFQLFIEFKNRSECAEVLSLWMSRFRNLQLTDAQIVELDRMNFSKKLSELAVLITDRWVSGDPSYQLLVKKSLQNIWIIYTELVGFDDAFTAFVTHAASYANSDVRIAYGVLESVARINKSFSTKTLEGLPEGFTASSFQAMSDAYSRSGVIGRCLAAILGPMGPKVWFQHTQKLISDPSTYQTVMTYFVEPVLKQSRESQLGFGEFYELCKPLQSPSVEIGILKAGKNAKIDVSDQIRSSTMISQSLSSLSRNLRFDALRLLCNITHKLSEPVPSEVFDLIITNADSLFAEGEPKSRMDVYSSLRNLLIRVKVSKSHDVAAPFVEFVANWCATSLCPGMPYRCLAMAVKLLSLFVEMEIPILSQEHPWHRKLMISLFNCVLSDFNDIREMSVSFLSQSPELPFIDGILEDLENEALKLMTSSRNGEAGARLWQFLYSRYPDTKLPNRIVVELESILTMAMGNIEKAVSQTRMHGLIASLRLTPPEDKTRVVTLVRTVCEVCTPSLTEIAPEGISGELINFCWKAIKESSLLLEAYTNADMLNGIDEISLLHQLSQMLMKINHWGAFTSVAPPFVAIAKRNPEAASEIVWKTIQDLFSGSDSRSVTRRSAGLPLLVTSCLEARFDEKLVDSLFELANIPFSASTNEAEELEMSQVHGMNCIRAVVTTAGLSKKSTTYLGRAFEQCLKIFDSPSWSLRNCAAMLFSSLFKRFFGVRGIPISGSVFFQKFKNMRGLLQDNLANATRDSDLHAVFPAVVVLGQLRPVSPTDGTLDEFWPVLVELLGSKAWKIRELAAHAVCSITHPAAVVDVVTEFCMSMSPSYQNEMHGLGLAVLELLSEEKVELPKCQAILKRIILANKCMETNTILYKCYARMGGNKRLVSFNDLPQYPHLNRSLATFEAEQVIATGKIDTSQTDLLHGWDPVLEVMPSSEWTYDLAKLILDHQTDKIPEVQVACLQSLEKAERIPWDEINAIIQSSKKPPSVTMAISILLAYHVSPEAYPNWSKAISEFSRDDAPVEQRRCALTSLQAYLSGHDQNDLVLSSLLRLVTDEEEDIRESASGLVSRLFGLQPTAPGATAKIIIENMDGAHIAENLLNDIFEYAESARETYESSDDAMFIVEKDSSFQDIYRLTALQLEHCRPTAEQKLRAKETGKLLSGLDFETPLRANADLDLLTVKMVVDRFQ